MTDKKELSQDEILVKAKSDALRLIAARARSVAELKEKLKGKGYAETVVDSVIETAKRQGLLNDEKFAQLYANSVSHFQPKGKKRIELELKKKGLSGELIDRTINSLSEYDEVKTARGLVQRRFDQTADLPAQKRKARIFGFLQRRGFSIDTIYKVMDQLFKGNAEIENQ